MIEAKGIRGLDQPNTSSEARVSRNNFVGSERPTKSGTTKYPE